MKELRILVVEDSQRDLDLIVREFRLSGYSVEAKRVETADVMSAALVDAHWDVIISDLSLPAFDATRAHAVLQARRLDVPFVIASGMIGEERAVELMKAGASDYVSKRNLPRLIPVIERELRDAAERLERHRVEVELARIECRARTHAEPAFGVAGHHQRRHCETGPPIAVPGDLCGASRRPTALQRGGVAVAQRRDRSKPLRPNRKRAPSWPAVKQP